MGANLNRQSERGNVLWFILVAVVLLGALTAVLTRGGGSVDQSGDVEQMRITASQIMRYAKSVETAIEQMQLRNISENEISFANTTTAADYTNASCDNDSDNTYPGCLVFNQDGGGIEYRGFEDQDWIFTGANNVGTAAAPIGTTAARSGNDLVMLLPIASEALCVQINREVDVDNPNGEPPVDSGIGYTIFTGTYASGGPVILDGDTAPFELDGHNAGCFTDTAADENYFYYVILTR